MRRRQRGQHPSDFVLVALDFWPLRGDRPHEWPQPALVVFDDVPLARLELRMLAGLSVLIACSASRLARAKELAQLIAEVRPCEWVVWLLEFETPQFLRLLAGGWHDFTQKESELVAELAPLLSSQAKRPREHDRAA